MQIKEFLWQIPLEMKSIFMLERELVKLIQKQEKFRGLFLKKTMYFSLVQQPANLLSLIPEEIRHQNPLQNTRMQRTITTSYSMRAPKKKFSSAMNMSRNGFLPA